MDNKEASVRIGREDICGRREICHYRVAGHGGHDEANLGVDVDCYAAEWFLRTQDRESSVCTHDPSVSLKI